MTTTIRRLAVAAALTLAAGLASVTLAATAGATGADCKTVATHLAFRPDSGNHGNWALDTFTRTVHVCQTKPGTYHAAVVDLGGFATISSASSPRQGLPLPAAGIPGTMAGQFTADFAAPADWDGFDASGLDGKTLTGAAGEGNPSTSDWVRSMWGESFQGSSINDDWTWTYRACNEQWTDAAANNAGQDISAGDITGLSLKPCLAVRFVDHCTTTTVTLANGAANPLSRYGYRVFFVSADDGTVAHGLVAPGVPVVVTAVSPKVKVVVYLGREVKTIWHVRRPVCPSPSPTCSPSPSTSPSPSSSPSPGSGGGSPSPSESTQPVVLVGGPGGLPRTGFNVWPYALFGFGLVLLGVLTAGFGRLRRRTAE